MRKNGRSLQEEQTQEATELYSKNMTIRCRFRKGEVKKDDDIYFDDFDKYDNNFHFLESL